MIPFTQYLRPHGERRAVVVERSPEIEQLAQWFIAGGGSYECEELTTGHASLTAVHPDCEAGDCAIEVVMNGPEVPAAVDRVVRRSVEWLQEQVRAMTDISKEEGLLLWMMAQINDSNAQAVLLQSFIAECGPLSEPAAAKVRELLRGALPTEDFKK